MSDKTIQALQETLAHQEHQISDLSEVLIRQSDEIAALKKSIAKLEGKIDTLQDDMGDAPAADQRPPHY